VHGIPYSEVSHRLKQYDIWVKNFDCKIDYRALTTAAGSRVDAGACAKTGDIALKVTTPGGKAAYEWIAFNQLQKAGQTAASVWQLMIGSAMAADVKAAVPGGAPVKGGVELAQAPATPGGGPSAASGMKVLCEAMPTKGNIVRVVQEGAKCFKENVSLFKGTLEKRQEVACTTTCK
jgi:hypothetical protein